MSIYPPAINGVEAYSNIKRIDSNTMLLHYGAASWITPELRTARKNRSALFQKIIEGTRDNDEN